MDGGTTLARAAERLIGMKGVIWLPFLRSNRRRLPGSRGFNGYVGLFLIVLLIEAICSPISLR